MFKFAISFFVIGVLSKAIATPGQGIVVQDYFEERCRQGNGFVTQNFRDWTANLTAGTPLYFPLMSSLDVLRMTQDLFKEADLTFLTAEQVRDSCITLNTDGNHLTFQGYCGQTFSKTVIPVAPKVVKWSRVFPGGVTGERSIALSDNKSWLIFDICWGDGQRSFAVVSLYPTLSECSRKVIVEFVKALGFHEKFFTGLKYDAVTCSCQPKHNPLHIEVPFQPYEPY